MNSTQADQIIEALSERQTLDMFDRAAILEVIAPHPQEAVVRAVIEIRKSDPYVGAANLKNALEGTVTAEAEWALLLKNVISSGAMAQARSARKPIPAELFPSPRARRAYQQARHEIQNGTTTEAWFAFRRAYNGDPETVAPHLVAVDSPPEDMPELEAGGPF